jgi:hypothetical protein
VVTAGTFHRALLIAMELFHFTWQLQLGYFTEPSNSYVIIPQGLAIPINQFHSVWWLLQVYFTGLCNLYVNISQGLAISVD